MSRFEKSIILMGIDWSKAAKLRAIKDIEVSCPKTSKVIRHLDRFFRKTD